ncbi:MAG: hypothetical protein ACRDM1_14610 [Gaiellaceae bacterium]
MKLFRRTKEVVVEFCERCSSVCDQACRARAIRDRARDGAMFHTGRIW